jgi:GAF domain-containing protein/anti-sigma regulatory factor (Ser/Thr protein kinase)
MADVERDGTETTRKFGRALGFNSILFVPLMREDRAIGVFALGRKRTGEYSQREVELVQTFADQAVIAIENARLFDEVQARTRDLTESLQQQTATADVLKIISRSALDLQAVLGTLTSSAVDLLGLPSGTIVVRDGDVFRYRTRAGAYWTEELWHYLQDHPVKPGRDTSSGRAIQSGRIEQIPDIFEDPEYAIPMKALTPGHTPRAILAVPLIGKDRVEGALSLSRQEPGLFTQREIDILQTFADQAVIAIENTRLFNETQEALEQQKASADILSVISNSVSETQPVFDEILRSIARLFGSQENYIFLVGDDDLLLVGAGAGWRVDQARALFPAPLEGTVSEVAIRERRLVRSANVLDDPDLPASARERYRSLGENYAMALAPMLWEDRAIGSIMVARASMEPFSDKECKLLSTFADQAVIAIQNARLFNETKEALERQTATSDILNVIAGSPTDTGPVFEAIASRAKSLVGGFSSTVFRFIDGQAHLEAFTPTTPEADEILTSTFPRPVAVFAPFRIAQSGEVTQIPDIEDQPDEPLKEVGRARGYRSMLFAPLMNKGVSIGFIGVTRVRAGQFDEHHVQLLRTFADQAVIAIGNVQLFDEVQQRTRELSKSLDDLRTAQDRLVQTEKLASLGQLTAGIAHEIKNPLNFVNNFAALSAELTDELDETLAPAPLDQKMRVDVGELTQMLKSNLEKVVQHGKRADSIVKNMLLHSREGSGERRSSDLNALVSESLNLAYHGARAERSDFNITLEQHLDPDAGTAEVYPQELTRALLNLISNGFYAAIRRKKEANGEVFEPVLSAATRNAGDTVEIRIRDNGTGIPAEIREKIFNPFFTTKPTGEGTGLGLSMTHDIIVKQHGGTIDVETEPGVFTEFRITLPRGNGAAAGPK